jgi:hypothetical protein
VGRGNVMKTSLGNSHHQVFERETQKNPLYTTPPTPTPTHHQKKKKKKKKKKKLSLACESFYISKSDISPIGDVTFKITI